MPDLTHLSRLLLAPLEHEVDRMGRRLMQPDGETPFDFASPKGESAILPPTSVSWRVFKNPVSLFVGGVTAVILELAHPSVRSGVWDHSSFRSDPVRRLRRTGLAAMISVYGPRSRAEAMIGGVVRRHGAVRGVTPAGEPYHANDPVLLDWVQATATFGFAAAYDRYASRLDAADWSAVFREAKPLGMLYGAENTPLSLAGWEEALTDMLPRLQSSAIVVEFLHLMSKADALPAPLRPLQRSMVRGAVALVPAKVRQRLDLPAAFALRPGEDLLLRQAGGLAERLVLRSLPPARSCVRLGLPEDYLYRPAGRLAAA